MDRGYVPGSSRPMPVVDNGERERLSFWRRHAVAIQSDLLEITGWLNRAPERDVLTDSGGAVQVVKAGTGPANVLFRIPREGTRAYQNWDWCLGYLRIEQSRRRLVLQQVEETERALHSAEGELQEIGDRHQQLDTRLRALAKRAQRAVERGSRPSRHGPYAQLREGIVEARANDVVSRAAERHRDTIRLRLEGLRDHHVPRVYPGLWARVNAFLDLQALSVANVASEEFRKVPRPLSRLATRLERELEED